MIHGIRKSNYAAFRNALEYNFNKPDTKILTSNMAGEDTDSLLAEFREQQQLNPNVKKSMVHANIRLPPDESLTPYQWAHVVDIYLDHLGYLDCPFVAFLESTGPNDAHVHIVASAIQDNGKRVSDSFDYYKGQKAMRKLEDYFGLRRVPNSWETGRKRPTYEEMNAVVRSGEPSVRYRLQKHVTDTAHGRPTLTEFLHRLQDRGVELAPRLTRKGRLTGVTYRLPDGGIMRGSDLGKDFAWPGLHQRLGVDYDPARDLPALLEARERFDAADDVDAAKTFLKAAIDRAVEDRPELPELVRRLRALGVGVEPNLARTGYLSGLSYHYRGVKLKASDLGRAYAPKGLERRGVRYDAERHHDELRELEHARQKREAEAGSAPVSSGQTASGRVSAPERVSETTTSELTPELQPSEDRTAVPSSRRSSSPSHTEPSLAYEALHLGDPEAEIPRLADL